MERRDRATGAPPFVAAALAAATIVLAVSGCGEPGEGDRARSLQGPGDGAAVRPLQERDDPRIARLLEADTRDPLEREPPVVRVLVSYDATNYFVDAGQQRGLEYELMRDLESFLDKRKAAGASPPHVVFIALSFDELIPSLLAGRGDVVAAGLTVTEARARRVAFSEPYRKGVREVVVRHADAPPVEKLADLAGRTIHVVSGSSYAEHLRALAERFEREGLEPPEVVAAAPQLRSEDLLEMVHAGIYELTVVDDHLADLWARVLDDVVVEKVAVHEGGELAWAVRPGNRALLRALDAYARGRRQGTLIGNVLFRRYYEDTRWVEDPTRPVSQGRLSQLAQYFRKSGQRHDFDWLALAAVAFQESHFDQHARSRAGAVGIMQIRPATAAEVGVQGVEQSVAKNVEAGARYLAFLRRHYFGSTDVAPAARFDFTLAAYNAGPARVQSLRREARDQGLDPNRWFGNVEHVARARIGRETVRYVANVNEVYVALRSVRDQLEARQRAREGTGAVGSGEG